MDGTRQRVPFKGTEGARSNAPESVTNPAQENNNLELDSKIVREENEQLKKLLKQRDVEIRVLCENNEQLHRQLTSAGVPEEGNAVAKANSEASSPQQPQASASSISSCGDCKRKDRLLKERDATIATLLSDVLQRLWATRSDRRFPNGGSVSSREEQEAGNMTPRSNMDSRKGCGGGGAIDKHMNNGVLQQQKILELFGEVLPVLIRQQGLKRNGCIDWREQWSLLLSCRHVCKSWKSSVEALLEDDSSHREICPSSRISSMTYASYYTPCPAVLEFHYSDGNNPRTKENNRISHFVTVFGKQWRLNPEYNPIPSRHLKIDISCVIPYKTWSVFSHEVLYYLHFFGPQVRHLTLHVPRLLSRENVNQVYLSFSNWLKHLPNLKSLTYGIRGEASLTYHEKMATSMMMGEVLQSFPQLQQLVTFQMEEDCVMGYHILKSNWHIQKLRLSHFVGENLTLNKAMELKFPNLTELSVCISSMEQMKKLRNVTWTLRNLSLSFIYMERCSMETAIFLLSTFRAVDTLQYLELDLAYAGISGYLGKTSLNLPRLKHLRIQHINRRGDLHWKTFLKELKQLESLEIIMNQVEDTNSQSSAYGQHASLKYIESFKSDHCYWNYFPKIRSVRITMEMRGIGKEEHCRHSLKRRDMPTVEFDVKLSEKMETQVFELHT